MVIAPSGPACSREAGAVRPVIGWSGWIRARHLAGLVLAPALVFAAVASARTVARRDPAPSDPGAAGWMSSHQNQLAHAGGVFRKDLGGSIGGLTVVTGNHWTRIDQPDRFWGAADRVGLRSDAVRGRRAERPLSGGRPVSGGPTR
jgi:hypothetical protein